MGLALSLAIVTSLLSNISPAQAIDDQIVNCGTSGTFTIVSNQVTASTNCRGSLVIPEGVTEIKTEAFAKAPDKSSYITSIIFPNSLRIIHESGFRAATRLTSIDFGTGIESIVHWNFADSNALTSVTIPSSVSYIGTGVFLASVQLESVTFLGNAPNTANNAFAGTKVGAVANVVSATAGFGASGSTWRSLRVSAPPAVPAFTLSSSSETRTVNTIATGFTINSTGGTIASFSVSPSVPAGMSFNTTTGALTGTPTAAATATAYTITATNTSGSAIATFTLTVNAAVVVDNSAAEAAEAAAKREVEKQAARAELIDSLKNLGNMKVELFNQAEIAGVTKENIVAVQAEIAALSEASRTDLVSILKIAHKFEVVGVMASERIIGCYSHSLIEIGLIHQDSKNKEALMAAIKKLPASERASYAAIEEAIDNEIAEIQARKDRYANILALIASRNGGR